MIIKLLSCVRSRDRSELLVSLGLTLTVSMVMLIMAVLEMNMETSFSSSIGDDTHLEGFECDIMLASLQRELQIVKVNNHA